MCGIAGKLYFDAERRVEEPLIRRMCAAIAHRGPDDEGVYTSGPVGLGHRRLSIIDLSPAGHQPMPNDDGSVWIVFNGEIYNFLELRRELEQKGVRFRSNSDTEVLLKLYEAHGPECVRRLHGMFAFAIWDTRRRRLFVARDRLGVKPLYYRLDADGMVFASELKALLQDPEVERVVDPAVINDYLTYQYVPGQLSVFKGVQKLAPAHYMVCQDGKVETHRYWKLDYIPKLEVRTSGQLRDLEEELRLRLQEAVRCRLVSDVPLGAFLSGGIDSSAVVAMMSQLQGDAVRTFSIGFAEDEYNELPSAQIIADLFHTRHTEFRVKVDAVEMVPQLVRSYDEPFAADSAIPTFILSKLARKHVTVVLNGDAGDENFAGYDRHVANDLASRLRGLATILGSGPARRLLEALPHGSDPRDPRWRLKRFVDQLGQSPEARVAGWQTRFGRPEKAQLYSEAFAKQVLDIDSQELLFARYREAKAADFLDKMLYSDVTTYLPDCLLVKVDIATMANSLEARSPFLDHTLMEFAARIPSRLKIRNGQSKWILKRALRGLLPERILYRRKMGFSMPLDSWLRGELKDMAHELLLSRRSLDRGYFSPAFIRQIFEEHLAGRWNWHIEIWTLMMLEQWHREFVDVAPHTNAGNGALHGPAPTVTPQMESTSR
jgi:asparagine synthase (glutamine-hydrolysing)